MNAIRTPCAIQEYIFETTTPLDYYNTVYDFLDANNVEIFDICSPEQYKDKDGKVIKDSWGGTVYIHPEHGSKLFTIGKYSKGGMNEAIRSIAEDFGLDYNSLSKKEIKNIRKRLRNTFESYGVDFG